MNRPNFLLITTDQQRFDTIAALGNPAMFTPHLDWLCDEGIAFMNCYTPSPVCMAARATIMTGLDCISHGQCANRNQPNPLELFDTLPAILTRSGYQTRAQGKMHFYPMRAHHGFEEMELPADYFRHQRAYGLPMNKDHGVGENELAPALCDIPEDQTMTHWTVRRSIDFLETRDPTRPFFLWTSFAKPHPPFDPLRTYWDLYADMPIPPPVYGDWSQDLEKMHRGFLQDTYNLNHQQRQSIAAIMAMRRAYCACIT